MEGFQAFIIETWQHWGSKIGRMILIVAGSMALFWILRALMRRVVSRVDPTSSSHRRTATLLALTRSVIGVTVLGLGATLVLGELGINLGPIIAAAGVAGVAIGFGAQSLVKDVLSGFFRLLENQVRVGDVVEAGGKSGLVEDITLRTISLRSFEGQLHIIPHGEINTISNMTHTLSRAVVEVGVAYREDHNEVLRVLKEVADDVCKSDDWKNTVRGEAEVMGIDAFGDSALLFKVRVETLPGQHWNMQRALRRAIKTRFDQENIEIPFPHQTIYWGENKAPETTPPLRMVGGTESKS